MRKPLSHLTNFVERHPVLAVVYLFVIFAVLRQFAVEGTVEPAKVAVMIAVIVLAVVRMRMESEA